METNMQVLGPGQLAKLAICEQFNFQSSPLDPFDLAQRLVKTMYDGNGICLTGPQVGINLRVFAMRGAPENFVCFNPRIVMPSEEQIRLEETSMSYPGLLVKIKRPQHVKVRFSTPNGQTRTETFTGLTARTFQHCMDFLNGEHFYSKANPIHRSQAFRKWKR